MTETDISLNINLCSKKSKCEMTACLFKNRCKLFLHRIKQFLLTIRKKTTSVQGVDEPIIYKKECFDWVTPNHFNRLY